MIYHTKNTIPKELSSFWMAHCSVFDNFNGMIFVLQNTSAIHIHAPTIIVCANIIQNPLKNILNLSYFIEKSCDFLIPPLSQYHAQNPCIADYLWQDNCLECFTEYDQSPTYFECNLALDGRYALYYFNQYRTPNILPPQKATKNQIQLYYQVAKKTPTHYHTRHVQLSSNAHHQITRIHPTAILYYKKQPIYYAAHHANPPDFHQKSHWYVVS